MLRRSVARARALPDDSRDRGVGNGHADGGEDEVPWVTASAVGQAAYCPYQLYLARSGAERDATAGEALTRGEAVHEHWTEHQRDGSRRAVARERRAALSRIAIVLLIVATVVVIVVAAVSLIAPSPGASGVT